MLRSQALLLALYSFPLLAADFSGTQALEYTRRIVAVGPRAAGSEGARKMQALILAELKSCGCQVTEDAFSAKTPAGPLAMKNLIAKFPGTGGKALVITGHYDTKRIGGVPNFVGANDGGASAGLLLEMARALKGTSHKSDIYLVWFDGEEAVGDWSATDSLYGSRHLAARWDADGTLKKISALINVDMIGDRDLVIEDEQYSSDPLKRVVTQVAGQLGHARAFAGRPMAIEDDHVPFLRKGVRAMDLIDFDYGPSNSWWHTAADSMDKLSANSLQIVGSVLVESLKRLDQ